MRKTVVNAQIEELYGEYLENPAQNELEAALAELGGKLDECPAITASDLAQYEEAARHAAFYAGYHKAKGDSVEWWWGIEHYDRVYMSKVFDDTYSPDIPAPFNADRIVRGGTGYCMGYEQKFTELVPTPRASDGKRAALNRCWMPDSQTVQVERERERETVPGPAPRTSRTHAPWENWPSEPRMGRVVDGVPYRVDRLRCLGNAVVPHQAYPFFKAIADIENNILGGLHENQCSDSAFGNPKLQEM